MTERHHRVGVTDNLSDKPDLHAFSLQVRNEAVTSLVWRNVRDASLLEAFGPEPFTPVLI